jgi:hypothetical protein
MAGVLALALGAPAAQAATIEKACVANLNWSSSSSWIGGVVPGVNDIGAEKGPFTGSCNLVQSITVDAAATQPLGSWITGQTHQAGQNAGGVSVLLAGDTTFAGDLYVREGEIRDQGHDLTVLGTLSNCGNTTCAYLNGEGNGLSLSRTGGVIDAANVYLLRATSASFRPGDSADNFNLACLSQRNACPSVSVTQDPTYYANTNEGLTITGALTLGTLSGVKSRLTLNWNTSGVSGAVDWTLRVAGNKVSTLQSAWQAGQLVIGTLPSGEVFSSGTNIFYDAATNYTYVGFRHADSDGDGVTDDADGCPTEDATGWDTNLDGCLDDTDGDGATDDIDVCPAGDDFTDLDGDLAPDACDICPGDALNDQDGDTFCTADDLCPQDYSADGGLVDADADSVCDHDDVCAGDDLLDSDGDAIADACDLCPADADNDADNDGVCGDVDACDFTGTTDSDGDGAPDLCDTLCPDDPTNDADFDGVCGESDPCPLDTLDDSDGDGSCDSADICPAEDDFLDTDGDGAPDCEDACPLDVENDGDGDGLCESADNCEGVSNSDQADADADGIGNACEPDSDADGIVDDSDNCDFAANPSQVDTDLDGLGDSCDTDDDGDGVSDATDSCAATPAGTVVLGTTGCSVAETCAPTATWKNHGAYVSCVSRATDALVVQGAITSAQKDVIDSTAARSTIGRR